MPPHECSGHSHDHGDHGDDLGLSLLPQVDMAGVRCLNETIPHSGRAILKLHEDRLSSEPYLISQEDDPELLLHIPFTEDVVLQHLSIRSVAPSNSSNNNNGSQQLSLHANAPPRTIKLFCNRDDLDFETARDMEPQMTLEALPPYHFIEGTIDYPLRPAGRFQHITSLTLFFMNNYGSSRTENDNNDDDDDAEDVSTLVTYVGLKGYGTKVRRVAVDTVYEAKPMPEDHKTPGLNEAPHQIN